MRLKYGPRTGDWRDDLRKGCAECFRVLRPSQFLVFKWNEPQIRVSTILALTEEQPLFGHKSGTREKTHWITVMKRGEEKIVGKPTLHQPAPLTLLDTKRKVRNKSLNYRLQNH